jgi:ABC-type phosphate/phosphonate transport system substrate-binding protein
MTARLFAASGTILAILLGVSGCGPSKAGVADKGKVQIGTTRVGLWGVPAEYQALHPRLEACFDGPVCFQSQPDGVALGKQLELGNLAYAVMSAAEYARVENPAKLVLLASGMNAAGKTTRKAFLVVKAGSHVKAVTDCAGKRFAFGAYGDLLTDYATRQALENAGVPVKKLLFELVPPPLNLEGRLYLGNDAAKTIAFDLTVNAGVIDEVTFSRMPEKGGNLITGPSKDQFTIVGETMPVPEMVIVAGPAADPARTAKLKNLLIDQVKSDKRICEQLGVQGFAEPDKPAYEAIRPLVPKQ